MLVMAQVALAVVLVTSAGLMVRSFAAVQRAELGFSAEPLLVVEVQPPEHTYTGREQVAAFFERATAALRATPGVRAAATVNPLPLNHENYPVQFATPALAGSAPEEWPAGLWTRSAPGYFDAMRITVVAGRDFETSDGAGGAPVVIVSRMLAEQHWPGENAVGQTLLIRSDPEPLRATVVGVVGDIRHDGLTGALQPHVYRPIEQSFARGRFIVVSAAGGDPTALAADVRSRLAGIDADLPITIRPMGDIVQENNFQWSISSIALTAFGSLAILLAALGLYGLIAYSVAQRRRELGIRLALGASGRQVRSLVVLEAGRLAGLGLLAGIIAALGVARLLASQLYGVGPFDPVTLAAVLAIFGVVAMVASARPASRAARIAPQEVMREE
jgi:predicted permease